MWLKEQRRICIIITWRLDIIQHFNRASWSAFGWGYHVAWVESLHFRRLLTMMYVSVWIWLLVCKTEVRKNQKWSNRAVQCQMWDLCNVHVNLTFQKIFFLSTKVCLTWAAGICVCAVVFCLWDFLLQVTAKWWFFFW